MKHPLRRLSLGVVAMALVFAGASRAQAQQQRVGLEETFDTVEGWRKIDFPGETAPLKELKSVDGVGVFVTHPAPLSSFKDRPKWLDGMEPYDPFANVAKTWPELDLGRFHYLVMKIDEMSCPAAVIVNHVDLPVAYTTGIRAVDLGLYEDLRGKGPVEFRMQFINTGGHVKIDWFRFVSELTAEEKKGLIPPGLVLRPQKLASNPTQGLDAVMQRAGRPRRDSLPAERLCFRDSATGAVIWRMTGLQSGATVVSDSAQSIFNRSGSHMLILGRAPGAGDGSGGPQLYDFGKDAYVPCPHAGISRFSPKDPDILWCIEKTYNPSGVRFHKVNIRSGLDEVAGEIRFDPGKAYSPVTDLGFSSDTDMVAVGLRETPYVFLFDPGKPELRDRVRMLTLPMRLKGMQLSPDGKRLLWHRCYWYESWEMDLASGALRRPMTFGGSHAGSGGGLLLAHYQGAILAWPEGLTDWNPADRTRILLNYRQGWHTDYGHLASDGLWYIANGSGGDMANQLIMASTQDPGTVLQIAFQNTSRNDWANNTVVRSSPDYTKLAWVSNLWGYDAVCVAYTRRPPPPRDLVEKREGDAVVLTWARPVMPDDPRGRSPSETLGHNIYRSTGNGPFLPLNREPIRETTYRDTTVEPDKLYKYVVAAQEHSGLEGTPSSEAVSMPIVMTDLPLVSYKLHIEAEHGHLTPPARRAFDGWTSGWRYVRIRKELEAEDAGNAQFDVTPQLGGDFVLWLRTKAEEKPGTWQATLDGAKLGDVAIEGAEWRWARLEKPLKLEAKKRCRLVLASNAEGLCLDKFILSQDPHYVPRMLDDRFTTPPGKLQYLVAKEVTASSVHLAWWNPMAEPDLDYYNVYAGETLDTPADQAHLIASTRRTEVLDWGLPPGKSTTYKVVAVNRQGLTSEPAAITVERPSLKQSVLLDLPIDAAKLDPRLRKETAAGKRYAYLPGTEQSDPKASLADIMWEFDLPAAGDYSIWCEYAPADYAASSLRVPVLLDDFLGGKAHWTMRSPYRAMSGPSYRLWKDDLWFVDKVTLYVWPEPRDLFHLAAGRHGLTLRMSPGMKEFHHKIGRLWVTNDPSFRPPGWDPQADLNKARIARK